MLSVLLRRLVPLVAALLVGQAGAATFTVTSAGDEIDAGDGLVTLREAISYANQDGAGESTIKFDLGLWTTRIELADTLTLDQPTLIDGADDIILAVAPPAAETAASMGTLFSLTENAAGTVFRALRFEGHEDLDLLDTAGDVSVENSSILGFGQVLTLSGTALQVDFKDSVLAENGIVLAATEFGMFSVTPLSAGRLKLDGCLLSGNGRVVFLENQAPISPPFSISMTGSRLTEQEGGDSFLLRGAVELSVEASTIDGNSPGSLITTFHGNSLWPPAVYLLNTTVSGNQWNGTSPLINIEADLFIEHSTLTANTATGDAALIGGSNVFIRHSVISGNPGVTVDLTGSGELLYSLVDNYGEDFISLSEVTGDPMLGPLIFDGSLTGAHLPDIQSPVIGAGEPGLTAGNDDTPARDQRGSDRIINGVIDIGAVEFNRAPILDVSALIEAFNDVQPADQPELVFDPDDIFIDIGGGLGSGVTIGMGGFGGSYSGDVTVYGFDSFEPITIAGKLTTTPTASTATTGTIGLDMDSYVSDPDGDQVTGIALLSAPDHIFLDDSTHVISGDRESFLDGPLILALTDEHGLSAVRAVQLTSSAEESTSTTDSSSGGAALWLLAVLVLLGRRRP